MLAPLLVLGVALVATPSGVASSSRGKSKAATAPIVFRSPSGNIHCRYFPSASTIGCLTLTNRIETMMRAAGRPYSQDVSHGFPSGPVLGYGKSRSFGGDFRCTSRKDGVSCRSLVTGRCFLAAREGSKLACIPIRSGSGPAPTTKPTPIRKCHPSYVGACLDPNASDYDCEGGSGDGPYYTGPVRVVGPDDFGLDRDGDGYACEG